MKWFSVGKKVYKINRLELNDDITIVMFENVKFNHLKSLIKKGDLDLVVGDWNGKLVIVAPLYVPLVRHLGFDLIWYGVLYTITTQIAYMTPPFGYNLFLMRAMAPPEIGVRDIYVSIVPFVLVMIIGDHLRGPFFVFFILFTSYAFFFHLFLH